MLKNPGLVLGRQGVCQRHTIEKGYLAWYIISSICTPPLNLIQKSLFQHTLTSLGCRNLRIARKEKRAHEHEHEHNYALLEDDHHEGYGVQEVEREKHLSVLGSIQSLARGRCSPSSQWATCSYRPDQLDNVACVYWSYIYRKQSISAKNVRWRDPRLRSLTTWQLMNGCLVKPFA